MTPVADGTDGVSPSPQAGTGTTAVATAAAGGTPVAEPGVAYWRDRARELGARAVVNLDHPAEDDLDAVSAGHRAALYPLFSKALHGSERSVLDLGCGVGRFTSDLAALVGGRAIGVDPVAELLAMAPADERVDYRLLEGDTLPLADDEVDVVFTSLVLGGIPGEALTRTVAELHRVLRPGGLVFLSESVADRPEPGHWAARTPADYVVLVPWAGLREIGRFDDAGDGIAVLAGRAE
ncbi:class I SAM-dependent methyltransferase [Patulibacter minatonensis]|uniref:class I SAM-dependent methyltransferase n=1 Tax=Patulibacter minatonensis TaxID=298163 RepID=UPI00047CEA0A|nr:class I SAM-dependent methyltransferase [Patulibacter minatonensis]